MKRYLKNPFNSVLSVIILCFVCNGCLEVTNEIPITMSLSTDSLSFPSSGGQKTFMIESNTNKWKVSSDVSSWLTFSPDSGARNGSVKVSVIPNTGTSPKPATITVSGTGVPDQIIKVTVNDAVPTLSFSPSSLHFAASGETITFTVKSNISWRLSRITNDARSWLELSRSSRTISDSIVETEVSLKGNANTGSSPREAKIAAFGTDVYVDTVFMTVTQAADPRISEFGNGIVAASSFGGGIGTANDPYLINNARELKKLVDDTNEWNDYGGYYINRYSNTYFKLMSNINVTANEWIPINFEGNFDGNGYTISGTLKSNKYNYFGFFATLFVASISNLTIAAKVINEGYFFYSQQQKTYTGAIAGNSSSSIINNCHITGSVTGGIGYWSETGGVLGEGSGIVIQNCSVSDTILGRKTDHSETTITGGIVGTYSGEIINSEHLTWRKRDCRTFEGNVHLVKNTGQRK